MNICVIKRRICLFRFRSIIIRRTIVHLSLIHIYATYLKMTRQELTIPLVKQYYYRVNSQIKVEVTSRLLDYYSIPVSYTHLDVYKRQTSNYALQYTYFITI